jgi:FkbM family methyltransferase
MVKTGYTGGEISNPELYIHKNMSIFSRFYKLRQNDVVLDIGAGIGTEVLTYSGQVGPTGHIYAIEADPITFRRLEKTCRLNNITNVTAINCAVSNSNANAFLKLVSKGGIANHLAEIDTLKSHSKFAEVPAIKLDDFVQKYGIDTIHFLKMNIEGAEKVALMGFELKYPLVTNWVISCHDFIGSEFGKTYDWVKEWFNDKQILLLDFNRDSLNIYETFYIYGKRTKDIG